MHHLLNGTLLPEEPQPDSTSGDESPTEEEIEDDDDDPTDSTVSLYTPNSKAHFSTLGDCDGVLRRSKRPHTPATKFVSYWPSKKARTSRAPQNDTTVSLQSLSVQSGSVQSAEEAESVSSDSIGILPPPDGPPVEYVNISDSSSHTGSTSSSSSVQYIEVVTISSGSGIDEGSDHDSAGEGSGNESGNESAGGSGGDSAGERGTGSEMSSVSGSDEGSVVVSEESDLTTPQSAPQSTAASPTSARLLPRCPLHSTQADTPHTLPTLRTTAVVTPSTQLLSSSTSTPHHSPQSTLQHQLTIPAPTPLSTTVPEQLHSTLPALLYTTSTTSNYEPELQLPYVHPETKIHIYTPSASDFRRVSDFLNLALTPTDHNKIRAICDTTPIAVCRNMSLPLLPSHYLCLDLSRELLSVRYFWKMLHKAQNPL